MGYHHVAVGETEPAPDRPKVRRSVPGVPAVDGVHAYEGSDE